MIYKFFPFLIWFKDYSFNHLKVDAVSGLTVALVLIPQSMAYAQLAGLPAYYGLYASFLPPMLASLFGSSRQLATGPVAVVSLMTSASLSPLATAGSEGYVAYAILLALMVGIFQLSLGILRLGLVVNFLSHPVVNGFTNAAALIIASSQLSKIFGVSVDSAEHHYETIFRVCQAALHFTHWPTFLMAVLAFSIMYGLRRLNPKIPNVLVAVVITTLLSWAIGFEHNTKVSEERIAVPEVREAILQFNRAVSQMEPLGRERTRVSTKVEEARQKEDPVAILETNYQAAVLNVKIEQLKEEAHHLREKIRGVLLEAAPEEDGRPAFYPKGHLPENLKGDGRTWRIRVRNDPLKTAELQMTGGGSVVGDIPRGLPALQFPKLDLKVVAILFPYAAIISLLGFMEAISIAKAMAAKTGQRLDPNQELIGQGIANILGAVGKSYPTSGSFSRSAVNLQAGAVSGLSSVFTSLMVVIALLFFTPLLYYLPQAVLASVIMMAVIGLINVSGFMHAWRAQWYDGAISIIAFIATLAFAPHLDKGIMIGVILSLGVFLYKSMRPTVTSLAMHTDEALRCANHYGLQQCEYVDIVRFDGPLFFANASFLEDQITERMQRKKNLRHIVIVANGINDMDASGEEVLSLLIDRVRSAGVDISFCGLNEAVMAVLKRTYLVNEIGEDHIFTTGNEAICAIHADAHRDAKEEKCPITSFCRIN